MRQFSLLYESERKRRPPSAARRNSYLYIFFSIAKSAAGHSCVSLLLQLCVRKKDRGEEREGKWLQFIMEMARHAVHTLHRAGLGRRDWRERFEVTMKGKGNQPTGHEAHHTSRRPNVLPLACPLACPVVCNAVFEFKTLQGRRAK